MFNYKKKLQKYKLYMEILNSNINDTNKIYNLINYVRDNNLLEYRHYVLGELDAIYEFYYLDYVDNVRKMEECDDVKLQSIYKEKIDADLMFINSLCDHGKIKDKYAIIYNAIKKVEKLSKYINDEDLIPLVTSDNHKKR